MWTNLTWATGLSTSSEKLTISIRMVSKLKSDAIGFCIQPLATRIHSAERLEPSATSQVTAHVLNFTETIPTEEEQTYKGGFEEEGHQSLQWPAAHRRYRPT